MTLTLCWTISAIVSYKHLINFRRLQRDSNIISEVLPLVVLALASALFGENHTFCEHYNMNGGNNQSTNYYCSSKVAEFIKYLLAKLYFVIKLFVKNNWTSFRENVLFDN